MSSLFHILIVWFILASITVHGDLVQIRTSLLIILRVYVLPHLIFKKKIERLGTIVLLNLSLRRDIQN